MCTWNSKSIDQIDSFVDNFVVDKSQQKGTVADLFKLPAIRRNTLLVCFCWLSFSMGYFGLLYNTPAFSWNPFFVFAFPGILPIPLNYVLPWLENIAGRKAMLTSTLLGGGTMLFLTWAFPSGSSGIIVCAWVGTLFSVFAFRIGYAYTKELYPTTLRTTGLGTASSSARIGSMISPMIALLTSVHEILPLLVYGMTMVAAGIGSVWIWPETRRLPLMYTVAECEREAARDNVWLACFKAKRRAKEGRHDVEL